MAVGQSGHFSEAWGLCGNGTHNKGDAAAPRPELSQETACAKALRQDELSLSVEQRSQGSWGRDTLKTTGGVPRRVDGQGKTVAFIPGAVRSYQV